MEGHHGIQFYGSKISGTAFTIIPIGFIGIKIIAVYYMFVNRKLY